MYIFFFMPNPLYLQSDSDEPSSGDIKRKRFAKPPDVGVPGIDTKAWKYIYYVQFQKFNRHTFTVLCNSVR